MFEHIGKKIKSFALILFWISIILFFIFGLLVAEAADSFWAFLLVVAVGVVISYLSVIVLYAFGQLVDNSDIIADKSERQVKLLKEIKAAFSESYTGLCTKANRQINLLEEIQCELARCHAADTAEEAPVEPVEEPPIAPAVEVPAAPVEEAPAAPVEEAPAAPVDILTSISMEPEEVPAEEAEEEASPVPTITCKKCGFALVDEEYDLGDTVFCPNCGSRLSEQAEPEGVCPGCGYDKAFGKFCPICGLKQHE